MFEQKDQLLKYGLIGGALVASSVLSYLVYQDVNNQSNGENLVADIEDISDEKFMEILKFIKVNSYPVLINLKKQRRIYDQNPKTKGLDFNNPNIVEELFFKSIIILKIRSYDNSGNQKGEPTSLFKIWIHRRSNFRFICSEVQQFVS